VVLDLKPLGQFSNAWSNMRRQAFQRQHKLMLMRIESSGASRLLAEVQEESNLMPHFGEGPVVTRCACCFHAD
jgi:hypothetical protein